MAAGSELGVEDLALGIIGLPILSYLLILATAGQIWVGREIRSSIPLAAAAILFLIHRHS